MRLDQKHTPLQDRRRANRLIFFYKVVEGLVPALPCHDYLTPVRANKRKLKPRTFKDCNSDNIIENQITNNSKCFKNIQSNSVQYKNSFFPRTIKDWNQLEDYVVCKDTVDSFSISLRYMESGFEIFFSCILRYYIKYHRPI